MKLNFEQIQSIATGVAQVYQQDGTIFARFTPEQEYVYQQYCIPRGKTLHTRCLAPAGVRLRFRTNSTRLGYEVERKCGSFENVAATIRQATAPYKNMTVISGFDFVPKDPAFFADQRLHPNDAGFRHYTENVCKAIKQYL